MSKRGQEEIVGFVAIIVIVALVVVFLLGLSLRNQADSLGESKSIGQFIESAKKFTSECDLGLKDRYATMEKLSEECYRNSDSRCFSGMSTCLVYNQTISKLIESNWQVGPEMPVKGYIWSIRYEKADSKEILTINNGSCAGQYKEEESLSPDALGGGTFVTRYRTCF